MASVTEELKTFILINFNRHVWLVAIILDSASLNYKLIKGRNQVALT